MTIMKPLSLNAVQEQSLVQKIKERVTDQFGFEVDFSKLKANEVDFSAINSDTIKTMDDTKGRQYSVPLKTKEGLDGEVAYTEVNGAWLYHVAAKTRNTIQLNRFRNRIKSIPNFNDLANYLDEKGYNLKADEDYVIQNTKYLKDKNNETLTQDSDVYVVPVYKDNNLTGLLTIDEDLRTPVIAIDDERIFVDEDGSIVSVMADSCNLSWTRCMGNCLPGCDNWQGCLLFFGSCLGSCCGCVSIAPCIVCGACLVVGVYCLWHCRMCVQGAARPEECPRN